MPSGSLVENLRRHFPRVCGALGDDVWRALMHGFQAQHHRADPGAGAMPVSFVRFLQRREASGVDPPWLSELAHHEYVELLLEQSHPPVAPVRADGDLLDGVPLLSLVVPLAYRWPVHLIGSGAMPDVAPGSATLLVARKVVRQPVSVMQVSGFEYALLASLSANRWPGRRHLIELARGSRNDPSQMLMLGRALLERLRRDGVILGTLAETGHAVAKG
ncbi:MAG: DUF2063 domain-containing protein [Luteimonas sp.]|nr:DUF2063 domain-containing protein [Luteimonas sp.]